MRYIPIKIVCLFVIVLPSFMGSALAQFETRSSIPVSGSPQSLAVGDFNRDGILDLAVGSFVDGQISILLGNGDGTFREPYVYDHLGATYLAAGDFRNKGVLDLAVTNHLGDAVELLLGNGDGTFHKPSAYPMPENPEFIALGDFNNDHNLDVVTIDDSGSCPCLSILLGTGQGSLKKPINTTSPFPAVALGLGDFNRDGNLDVMTVGQFGGTSEIGVLLGNGDGSFTTGESYPTYGGPQSIAVASFSQSPFLDVAIADSEGGAIDIFLGNGDGTFREGQPIAAFFPADIVSADFNGDGIADLAVLTGLNTTNAAVFLGNGDGTFQPEIDFPAGGSAVIATGDFNGDHLTDMAIGNYLGDSVIALANTGTLTFSPTIPLAFKKQAVGTKSTAQEVTLTNSGKTPLTISSMKAAGQFAMTSTCSKAITPSKSCTISVTFSPKSQGAKSGTIIINDSASSKPQVIELSGTGT